jgi:Polysaccharide biosynthesis protein
MCVGQHYQTVRFGNVRGYRGFTAPTSLAQTEQGFPAVVTRPDIHRSVTTITESTQPVLRVSSRSDSVKQQMKLVVLTLIQKYTRERSANFVSPGLNPKIRQAKHCCLVRKMPVKTRR